MADVSKKALAEKEKKSKEGEFNLKGFTVKVYDGEVNNVIKATESIPTDVENYISSKSLIKPPVNHYSLAELYDLDPTHGSCIEIKVNMVLGGGWRILNKEHRNKNKSINDFLLNPNENFSETIDDILEKLCTYYETFGNSYLEVVKINNEIAVYHIPARDIYVKPVVKGNKRIAGKVQYWIQKHPQGEVRKFEDLSTAENIVEGKHYLVQLKRYSPKSSYYGVPKYVSSVPAIIENIYIREYGMSFFKNDAKPAVAIVMTGGTWGDKQDEALASYLQKNLKGRKKSHKVLLLHSEDSDAKIKIEELSKGMEGSFLKEAEKNRDEIARVHGPIPPKLLGISGESSIGGGGESIGELKTFIETVINKKQRKIENFVNKLLMLLFDIDYNPSFKLGDIDIISSKDRAVIHGLYAKIVDKDGKPVMTVDEIREDIGIPIEAKGEYMSSESNDKPVEDNGGVNVGDTQEDPHGITNTKPDKNQETENPE